MMENKISARSKTDHVICNYLFLFTAIFALLKPDSLQYIGLQTLEAFLVVFDFIIIILLIILLPSYKISMQTIFIGFMYLAMTISTFIHKTQDYKYLVYTIGPAMAVCLLTDYCMQKAPEKFLFSLTMTFAVLFSINLITIIAFPNGLYQSWRIKQQLWFMGYDNGLIYNLVPYVGISLVYSQYKYKKLFTFWSIYSVAITIITELIVWSATGVVTAAFMMICILCINIPFVKKIVQPKVLIGVFYIGTILIVIFRMQNLFEPIIVDILHKDLTFTGRTYLWDYSMTVIKDNLLLGVGQAGYTVVGQHNTYLHPHCLLLDMLYKGGIIMFVLFNIVILRFCKQIKRHINEPAARVLLLAVSSILFGEIINSAQYKQFFWCLIVIASYLPELTGTERSNNKEFIRLRIT